MYQQLLQGAFHISAPLCTSTAPLGDPIEVSALGQGLTSKARGGQQGGATKARHVPIIYHFTDVQLGLNSPLNGASST